MFTLLLAAALVFTENDAHLSYERARDLVEKHTPRDAGSLRAKIAANSLLDAASAVGADVRRDIFRASTPHGEKEFVNLYAEFKSDPAKPWVVILSHYDTKPGTDCPGANDGASTSGLLIGLANAFANWDAPSGNLLLVWTDGEESMESYGPQDGFWGSKRAVEYVRTKERNVRAVICLDMLGDRDLGITIPSNGSPALKDVALLAAKRCGFPKLVKATADVVKDDHVAFLEKGYKAIDLIDFNFGPNNAYWHTPQDTMDKISEDSLLKVGRLVVEMLKVLL